MKILTIGSINIDHVYEVAHFVRPGETLSGSSYRVFAGGKGFNQSVALARAGAVAYHAGRIGAHAEWLLERLQGEGVDTTFVIGGEEPTGHAIIQIAPSGENAIVLYGGANRCVTETDIDSALSAFSAGDYLLLQNETSGVPYAMRQAHAKGLKIAFNPAPMASDVQAYPLELVDLFILNETEAEALTGSGEPQDACRIMRATFPNAATLLTLGAKGAMYSDAQTTHVEPAHRVDAVDTTAAGDTFIGYCLAELMQSGNPHAALTRGCCAAALCVMQPGAADSIPTQDSVNDLMQTRKTKEHR